MKKNLVSIFLSRGFTHKKSEIPLLVGYKFIQLKTGEWE